MRKTIILTIGVFVSLTFSSCRVSFPAQSEEAYQKSISAIKSELNKEGFSLIKFNSKSGTTDNETYTFRNNENDEIEFTISVERDSDNEIEYIKNVEIRGCTTSKVSDFDNFCGYKGIVANTLKDNTVKDIEGKRVDAGATVRGIIFANGMVGILGLLVYLAIKKGASGALH